MRKLIFIIPLVLAGCATNNSAPSVTTPFFFFNQEAQAKPKTKIVKASWYKRGRRTASGERFRPNKLTAAHRTLPFGTRLKVTNLANGKYVVVRINDRGPFVRGKHLDLSRGAAKKIGMIKSGTAKVRIQKIK